jgi:hypothetical protein
VFTVLRAGISILVSVDARKGITTAIVSQLQVSEGINIYMWIPILLISILSIFGIFSYIKYGRIPKWFSYVMAALGAILGGIGLGRSKAKKGTGDITLDEVIEAAGYSYDIKQDIFYSNLDAWQRDMGYCRLYDEAAAPMGMIIDCEPIYFEYDNKKWMIELWKGQYDLTTGCEIGVYTTEGPDLNIAGVFKGTFYYCASNEDLLHMSYTLIKNGEKLFTREDKHWWLTGFKLGEFSEPLELEMNLNITLKDETMCNVFIKGLQKAGYSKDEIVMDGNTVGLKFDKPRTPQPITRTAKTDEIIQWKNKLLCDKYQEITGPYDNFPDKVNAIREQAPELYEKIINMGKTKSLFDKYEIIKKYLN